MYEVNPIGRIHSALMDREHAPKQGSEGAPEAWLVFEPAYEAALKDRPNPIGIHRVRIVAIESPTRIKVSDMEAFDATPIIDVKPVLDRVGER